MMLVLGFIIGLLIAILIVTTLTFFRRIIEHKTTIIEKMIDLVGPRPKGFIIEPPEESEEIRANIVSRNRKQGRDTPIEDLR